MFIKIVCGIMLVELAIILTIMLVALVCKIIDKN